MKKRHRLTAITLMIFLFPLGGIAQTQNETELIVRAAPGGRADYHLVEVFQTWNGRWIVPDIGYIDFAHANTYREVFFCAGAVVHNSKYLTFIEEGCLDQATGPAADSALYFQPWTFVGYRITPKISGETVYLPYLPLKKSGHMQHVLERAKLEYDFKRFKAGAGYGAYQYGRDDWQHKPFVTITIKAGRFGNFEFWGQYLPGNHIQPQLRYSKTFK